MKQWFQVKEALVNSQKLYISWLIYKAFGTFPLRIIAFFVILFGYFKLKEQRGSLGMYLKTLKEKTGNNLFKPSFLNKFKIFLNYANSLVDKIDAFSGNFKDIVFKDEKQFKEISDNLKNKCGMFFITNHIGNAEIMRILMNFKDIDKPNKVNVFLQKSQCKIFNNFLNKIAVKIDIEVFAVEDIDFKTSILIKEKLDNGEIVFMAGDRLSANNVNACYEAEILNKKVKLPIGVLKFALLTDTKIYLSNCAKNNGKYEIYLKKFERTGKRKEDVENLKNEFSSFLEENILKYPFQYYHFYSFFN